MIHEPTSHPKSAVRVSTCLMVFLALALLSLHGRSDVSDNVALPSMMEYESLTVSLEQLLEDHGIPGAAAAIISSDGTLYLHCIGMADIERGLPVDPQTLFRAGSISKSFVALAVLNLVEEGKLDLWDPVSSILPDLEIENPWEPSHPLRVVHLLEHTSGLRDPHFNDYYLSEEPGPPLLEGLQVSENYLKLRWRPGQYQSYSSAGYMISGIIIEVLTDKRFEDYVKSEILDPIGMTHATFDWISDRSSHLAQGYRAGGREVPFWQTYSRPAGSLNTSIAELSQFVQVMLNRGRIEDVQALPSKLIDRMETSATDPGTLAGLRGTAGLGLGVSSRKGFRWYSHFGSIMGFAGAYGYCRELGIGCVLLTNTWDATSEAVLTRLWNTLRDHAVGDAEPPTLDTSLATNLPSQAFDEIAGTYRWRNPPQPFSTWIDGILNYMVVEIEGDGVRVRNVFFGDDTLLSPVTTQLFRHEHGRAPSVAFLPMPGESMALIQGSDFYEKTPGWMPWLHGGLFAAAWVIMLSSLGYALVWIPIDLVKRISGRGKRSSYLRMRVAPLAAVLVLIVAFTLVGMQAERSLALLGQKTAANVLFCIATWGFALLSALSLLFAIRSFSRTVKPFARIYALALSLCCVGITAYLGYWGIIGVRLWAY